MKVWILNCTDKDAVSDEENNKKREHNLRKGTRSRSKSKFEIK